MAEIVAQYCRQIGLSINHVILAGHSCRVSGRQVFNYDEARKVVGVWKGSAGWAPEVTVTWSATIKEAMEMVERLAARDGNGGAQGGGVGAHAPIVGSSHLVSSAMAAMSGSIFGRR